jgi:hypothetical protein
MARTLKRARENPIEAEGGSEPTASSPQEGAESSASSEPSKARNRASDMYEEWKKRFESSRVRGGADMYAGQPYPSPFPYPAPYPPPGMMPQPPYPPPGAMSQPPYPPPGMMPQPPYPPQGMMPHLPYPPTAMGGRPGTFPTAGQSLLESLGSLVHLGIEAINAGLAGGIGIMRGIAGAGAYEVEPYWHGASHPYASAPGWEQHGCGCHDDCGYCCDPCDFGCHPSVHNCY